VEKEKYEHRILIGFVYRYVGGTWQLGELVGEEVAMDLGIYYLLSNPPTGAYPQQTHLTRLLLALARHNQKLDGGGIFITANDKEYRAVIQVKPQQEKPQHREQEWKESS
jgi:hypothetical protein